jgi:UDP-N-acetylglucosamine acyltransferase
MKRPPGRIRLAIDPMISPHAIIDPKAQIAPDVEIGPFCVIGPEVRIESGCRLINSVTIFGRAAIGRNNILHPNVVLGGPPQDRKYKGAPTGLEIGQNNVLREAVTIHRGTEKGGGITRVGNNNMLMVNAHLGHDVQFGSNCTLANNVMVAGHVVVGDHVNMAGGVGIHHFVRIGEYSFLGGYARIHHDVPPFTKVDGADQIRGLNEKSLLAAGFSKQDTDALEECCRRLFYRDERVSFSAVLAEFDTMNGMNIHVKRMVEFLRERNMGRHGRYLERARAR